MGDVSQVNRSEIISGATLLSLLVLFDPEAFICSEEQSPLFPLAEAFCSNNLYSVWPFTALN